MKETITCLTVEQRQRHNYEMVFDILQSMERNTFKDNANAIILYATNIKSKCDELIDVAKALGGEND